jgi:hypothetical protein
MNAETLEKSKKEGINNIFIKLLDEFQLKEGLVDLFKKQLGFSRIITKSWGGILNKC